MNSVNIFNDSVVMDVYLVNKIGMSNVSCHKSNSPKSQSASLDVWIVYKYSYFVEGNRIM